MKRLFFLAAGMFTMGFEDYLFEGLLPGIGESLRSDVVTVAQGCVTFGLAYILSIPLCAYLLSRINVRKVLITAICLFIAGNLMTLLSTNLVIYFISRFFAGLGGGIFLPVAVAAGTQLVDSAYRGRALSVMWGANCAGAVVGVPLGLWLANIVGWRLTISFILLLAVFSLFGIIFRSQKYRVSVKPPSLDEQFRLLLDRRVLAVVGVTFLTATGCLGLYTYISQVLSKTENSADVAFSLWSLGGLAGSVSIGYFLDQFRKSQLIMGIILSILLVSIASIPILREVKILGLVPFFIWGAMGWASVTTQQYNLIDIKPDHEAILVALNSSAVSLGSVVGTSLGGLALSNGVAAEKLPFVTACFVLCALTFQWILIRKKASQKIHLQFSAG